MSNQKEPSGIKRKGIIIIIIIAFAILLTALVACAALLLSDRGRQEAPETTEGSRASILDRGFIDENNAQEMMSEMSDKVAEGMFECMMTTTWTFEDADSVSQNAYVANVENNLHTMYFDVYEEGTDELLYSSPMLPAGTETRNIKLDKKLDAGEYKAVVMYTMVDENYEEVSKVGFNITIYVVN